VVSSNHAKSQSSSAIVVANEEDEGRVKGSGRAPDRRENGIDGIGTVRTIHERRRDDRIAESAFDLDDCSSSATVVGRRPDPESSGNGAPAWPISRSA